MDYEKAYKDALERARRAKNGEGDWRYYDAYEIIPALEEIFPELRESEDEKIRKVFLDFIDNYLFWGRDGITKEKALAWLEKQKAPHYTKRNALFDKCVENCDPAIMKEVSDNVDKMLEKEQKPAEWSEEDEKMRNSIIADYERSNKEWFAAQCSIPWGKKIDWLKSLRPQKKCSDCAKNIEGYIHGRSDAENKLLEQFGAIITPEGELRMKPRWKPSNEQMGALSWMLENARANIDFDPLKDLYEQLKKL